TNRGLERNQMERLATLDFVHKAQNLFITGSSGTGKSYQALREVLELGEDADFLPDEDGKVQPAVTSPTPLTHKNIRGREYYRKDKQ
ncbi:ATP-binding protein, partial [Mediterranea massiliensis]|uniref:ATP-binding protein n=1 Tax=Mediterranea massiliensis TaxID=1841865 RepID=UPI001EF5B2E0